MGLKRRPQDLHRQDIAFETHSDGERHERQEPKEMERLLAKPRNKSYGEDIHQSGEQALRTKLAATIFALSVIDRNFFDSVSLRMGQFRNKSVEVSMEIQVLGHRSPHHSKPAI